MLCPREQPQVHALNARQFNQPMSAEFRAVSELTGHVEAGSAPREGRATHARVARTDAFYAASNG